MKRLAPKGRNYWMNTALAAVFLASGALAGCSSDSGEDDPQACETKEECPEGFSCSDEGICVDSALLNEEEGPPPIEEEEYQVSFMSVRPGIGAELPPEAKVQLVSVPEGTVQDLLTEEVELEFQCATARTCSVTPDQKFFVAIREGEEPGEYDIYSAAFDADTAEVVGTPEKILSKVINPRLRGNGVIFDRVEQETYVAYYREFGSTEDVQVATLAHISSSPTQFWDADPVSGRAIVFVPTLDAIDIRIGTISGGVTTNNHIINFGRNNFPGDAGSFYVSQHPVGFSPDGRFVAIKMEGPNAHGACQLNSDCQGTSQICGTENRCVALETTLHIIDMDHFLTLEDPCNSHEMCGPVHRCDSPAANLEDGRCMPQRAVIGVPHFPAQGDPVMAGCVATREDGSYSYTDLNGPFTYGPDGRFYAVGRRDCIKGRSTGDDTEANIARSSILAIDPETAEVEEIFGNIAGDDFDDARCYNEATRETVTEDCVIDILSAQLSPEGNDLVFLGTNPSVTTPQLASQIYDIWRVRRDGEDHQWVGKNSTLFRANGFVVHPNIEME